MTTGTSPDATKSAAVRLAASLVLLAYVAVSVLKQSDAEIVLPNSRFGLGGLLDRFKDGVPGGAFLAPVLNFEIPLYLFYTLSPIGIVLLHASLLWRTADLRAVAPGLRRTFIWSPLVVLILIAWRFAPYVSARPEAPLAGQLLEALQYLAIAVDSWLILHVLLVLRGAATDLPGEVWRRTGHGRA